MNNDTPETEQAGTGEDLPANQGSLERALAGDYLLSPGQVISEAWGRTSGNKGTLWGALLMYMGVLLLIGLLLGMLFGSPPAPTEGVPQPASIGSMLQQLLITLVATPLWVGIFFLGAAIASDRPVRPASIFSWYDKTLKLFATYLLMGLMITLGLRLLVLPGIYLAVAYQMALPLAADRDLGPWEALETSRKALTHKWFAFFGLWLVALIAITASMVLLGIPLIWVLPTLVIGLGIVYRNIFGVGEASLNRVAG